MVPLPIFCVVCSANLVDHGPARGTQFEVYQERGGGRAQAQAWASNNLVSRTMCVVMACGPFGDSECTSAQPVLNKKTVVHQIFKRPNDMMCILSARGTRDNPKIYNLRVPMVDFLTTRVPHSLPHKSEPPLPHLA